MVIQAKAERYSHIYDNWSKAKVSLIEYCNDFPGTTVPGKFAKKERKRMAKTTASDKLTWYCPICNRNRATQYFYTSKNPIFKSHIPFCTTCINKLYQYNLSHTLSDISAMWYTCAMLGIPFVKIAWDDAQNRKHTQGSKYKNDYVTPYIDSLRKLEKRETGFWESDVSIQDLIQMDTQEEVVKKPKKEDFKQLNSDWGNYNADDLLFLNNTFEDYTKDLEDMDTNLINRYRDLCKAELRLRKANEDGTVNEVKSAQEILNKQLALLGLNNFNTNTHSDEEMRIERLCWMIENKKPAECEDLNIYKDFSGFGKTWDSLMRCVRNLVANTRDYPDISKIEESDSQGKRGGAK